jgi:hypothetical protein
LGAEVANVDRETGIVDAGGARNQKDGGPFRSIRMPREKALP